jgi:hypothetical protein
MQLDRQERISERAYQIWVAEGRVHGKHDEHWHRAEREIAEEELRLAAAMADRAADVAASGTAARRRKRATPPGAKAATGKSRAAVPAPARRRAPAGPSSS